MIQAAINDMDYLAARVHGRRNRMAEGGRLDALCRVHALPEFAQTAFPGLEPATAPAIQRRAVQEWVRELSGLRAALSGGKARWLDWLLVRFQVENLKVLLRSGRAKLPFDECQQHLVELPRDLALKARPLSAAESPAEFVKWMPRGVLRQSLARAVRREPLTLFVCEAALDQAYFQELMVRTGRLAGEDGDVVKALMQQDADTFHLMLVARGWFHYGLKREALLTWHVAGTRIARARMADMLTAPGLHEAMTYALGLALDGLPAAPGGRETVPAVDATVVEALAWKRLVRLAGRAFRQGHAGLGAVAGYVVLRRAEMANLITLSEGLRLGVAADALRARMIPRGDLEVAHV